MKLLNAISSLTLLVMLNSIILAQTSYEIIDTNQSICYDNTGVITCPGPGDPFYGQDAQ